jgi:SAM-dependent methyltransferase
MTGLQRQSAPGAQDIVRAVRTIDTVRASSLIRYSLGLGLRALRRRDARRAAAWRIWMPLDVDRVAELPWAGNQMLRAGPRRILDLASPKLLAFWLAERAGAEVVATDAWDAEVESWQRLARAADPLDRRLGHLSLEVADGTALPYPAAEFDAAYSVSVIEHIPGDGDTRAMAELERVLRPGATLALTFPFRERFEEEFVRHDLYGQRYEGEPIFFQRHYSLEAVRERLLTGREFEVLSQGLWRKAGVDQAQRGLRRLVPARWELGRYLGPALPLIGTRALSPPVDVSEPGSSNVMFLLLRRTSGELPRAAPAG